jgi:hypothetical protein
MKIKKYNFYRIQHLPSGLFKNGGHNGKFGKEGKMWMGGRIKSHLRLFDSFVRTRSKADRLLFLLAKAWNNMNLGDCEIIEYELKEVNRQPLEDFVKEEMDN